MKQRKQTYRETWKFHLCQSLGMTLAGVLFCSHLIWERKTISFSVTRFYILPHKKDLYSVSENKYRDLYSRPKFLCSMFLDDIRLIFLMTGSKTGLFNSMIIYTIFFRIYRYK